MPKVKVKSNKISRFNYKREKSSNYLFLTYLSSLGNEASQPNSTVCSEAQCSSFLKSVILSDCSPSTSTHEIDCSNPIQDLGASETCYEFLNKTSGSSGSSPVQNGMFMY